MPYFRWIQAGPLTDIDASEFFLEIEKVKDDLRQLPISFNLGHSDRDRFDSIEKIISDYINASADTYSSL